MISSTQKVGSTKTSPTISVILVTYKEDKELLLCLVSLLKSQQRDKRSQHYPAEIIVVDNNVQGRIKKVLAKKFPEVRYINSGADIGYGAGNNLGAQQANGKYLFFVNPDTKIEPGAITLLAQFLENNPSVGIVAPTLYDMQGNRYPDQGSQELTPLTAIASHSIFHRIWSDNPISRTYWLGDRDINKPQQLAVVPGTAFMILRALFEEVKGFDERFFLYFEESDLCRRVRQRDWEVWQIPNSRLRHIWHAATQGAEYNIHFRQSRYKYFQKYYGTVIARIVEVILNLSKKELSFVLILLLVGLVYYVNDAF